METTKEEQAAALMKRGYNCAQAVVCVYADEFDVPKETLFRLAEGFGAGMGDMTGVCGALSGAVMLAGLKNSTANLEQPDSKKSTLGISRQLMADFLKGIKTGKMLCSCPDCVRTACRLVEKDVLPVQKQ